MPASPGGMVSAINWVSRKTDSPTSEGAGLDTKGSS